MFALLVPLVLTGSWAEKLKFKAFILIVIIWPLIVYYPITHWVWNTSGWLNKLGAIDFAGGITIHTTAGISGLILAKYVEKRKNFDKLGDAAAHKFFDIFILNYKFK